MREEAAREIRRAITGGLGGAPVRPRVSLRLFEVSTHQETGEGAPPPLTHSAESVPCWPWAGSKRDPPWGDIMAKLGRSAWSSLWSRTCSQPFSCASLMAFPPFHPWGSAEMSLVASLVSQTTLVSLAWA